MKLPNSLILFVTRILLIYLSIYSFDYVRVSEMHLAEQLYSVFFGDGQGAIFIAVSKKGSLHFDSVTFPPR